MCLLVSLTGAAGFVTSYLLLRAGLIDMWVRYLASIGVAYLVFLVLLWLWLRTRADEYVYVPDVGNVSPWPSGPSGSGYSGHGGEFGGGGSSGSFDTSLDSISVEPDAGPVGDALDSVADADELTIPLFSYRCRRLRCPLCS
jgi:hypothetical protein